MLIMPVSYCFGASIMHTHLLSGRGVVLDSRFMFPDKVLQAVNAHGCTTFAGVPTVYNILLRRSHIVLVPGSYDYDEATFGGEEVAGPPAAPGALIKLW